ALSQWILYALYKMQLISIGGRDFFLNHFRHLLTCDVTKKMVVYWPFFDYNTIVPILQDLMPTPPLSGPTIRRRLNALCSASLIEHLPLGKPPNPILYRLSRR